jgi:hypothetical protein
MTLALRRHAGAVDLRVMASLPVLPVAFARRHAKHEDAEATRLAADVDAKLQLARRLREEDAARRATSVAPPTFR